MRRIFLFAALAALSMNVMGSDVRAVTCHGCTNWQLSKAATKTVDSGVVYVFDAYSKRAHKFKVYTELFDGYPYGYFTQAVEVTAEWRVRNGWKLYVESVGELLEAGRIQLPGDFPVRSVAGALLDPAYSTTHIEDYLRQLSEYQQLAKNLSTLTLRLLQAKIPLLDVQLLVDDIILTVEFPDGSTQDYVAQISVNSLNLDAHMEVEPYGNARLEDGSPAPTSSLGFSGRTFNDNGGSLFEWMQYARSLGISIGSGGSGGRTTMTCTVSDSVIICYVVRSK